MESLKDLVVYLRSVPPVNRATPAKKITVPMFESVFLPAWLATFAARETPPAAAPTSGVARGEYLTRAVAHCGECHTPRTMTMAVDNSRFLAGAPKGKGPEPDTGTPLYRGDGGGRQRDRLADPEPSCVATGLRSSRAT
jgi:mono/diheme cytochrome c family protein